jgi:hypothetical protein
MSSNEIVSPGPEIFNFVGSDGKDLRTMVMEINQMYAEYSVQRNTQQPLMAELKRLRDDVETRGASRDTMAAVESFEMGPLNDRYPLHSYTQRRSRTNVKVALEEIDARQAGILAALGVAGLAILYKVVKWVLSLFGKNEEMANAVGASAVHTDVQAAAADKATPPSEKAAVAAAVKQNTKYTEAKAKLDEGVFNQLIQNILSPTGYAVALRGLLNGLPHYVNRVDSLIRAVESLEHGSDDIVTGRNTSEGFAGDLKAATDQLLSDWDDIGKVYPELDRFLKDVKVTFQPGVGAYSNALGAFRQRCNAEAEQRVNQNMGVEEYINLNREVIRCTGNGSGHLAAFDLPEGAERQLKALERSVEKLSNNVTRLRGRSNAEHLDILQDIHKAMEYVREYSKVLSGVVSLAPWLLSKVMNFQKVVRDVVMAKWEEAEKAAKAAGNDITAIRQEATAEEERILRNINR